MPRSFSKRVVAGMIVLACMEIHLFMFVRVRAVLDTPCEPVSLFHIHPTFRS
jgi:hypothetical protein